MISKRYYLTVLGLIPILVSQALLVCGTWKKAQTSRNLLVLWRAYVIIAVFLIFISVPASFDHARWVPPFFVIVAQTTVNLGGLITAAAAVSYFVARLTASWLPIAFRQDRRKALQVIAGVGIAAPVAVAGFGTFVERTNFEVCEVAVGWRNLPGPLEGLRLLQLSDIHLGAYLSTRTLAKVIDCANELKAHLAFVTGDLISVKDDPLEACLLQLARLKTGAATTMGCMGNHEIYADALEYTARRGAALGIEFLRNETKSIAIGGAVLNIAGVDYEPFDRKPHYLRQGGSLIRPDAFNVLLSHNPDVFPVAARQGYDLTLSGHMHGGQVTFEMIHPALNPARILTPFVRGLYRHGDRACYVTRGIGTLGVPARLGARPEITLLTLKSA